MLVRDRSGPGREREMALYFLRQLGASAGTRRVPAPAVPGPAPSMGRAASPMDGMAGPDGGLFDRGLPSVGRGGGNLLTPAFAFTRETRQGGLLSFWSQTDAVVVRRAASGRWARRRRAHDDGRDRLREGAVYPMGILIITYVRGDSFCPRRSGSPPGAGGR